MKDKLLLKDIVLIPALAAILFVQQMALSFIPNVQLTTLLILLYTKVLGFKKSSLIMLLHIIAYNYLSPFGPVLITHLPFIIIAWVLYIGINKITGENIYTLAVTGLIFGFIYGWILSIPAVLITDIPFKAYIISDIPFEIIMGLSNFVTILWLYEKLKIVLINLINNYYEKAN